MSATIINLFGSPGSGKSTTAAGVFSHMKSAGYDVELVTEFAKDLVWEDRISTLKDQFYVSANQIHRINRLKDKVNFIITDSPFLLGSLYVEHADYPQNVKNTFSQLIVDLFNLNLNVNFYLEGDDSYNQKGRIHTRQESVQLKTAILSLLEPYIYKTICGNKNTYVNKVFKRIKELYPV